MQSLNEAISAFLASKPVTVTGVFRTPRTRGSSNVYRRLRERGCLVFEVNPNTGQVEADRCYRDAAVVRRDAVARFGTRLLTVLNTVSARLATGSLRDLDAQGWARASPGRRGLAARTRADAGGGAAR